MRGTAVVLRKKHAVVRHDIYKYAVVHTSNRNKSFDAQANAKHQSSNKMAKGLVSKIIRKYAKMSAIVLNSILESDEERSTRNGIHRQRLGPQFHLFIHPFRIGFTRFHSTNSTTAFLAPLSPQTKAIL